MTFAGFPTGTITFLLELAADNSRAFFEENRDRYERDVKAPAFAFISALGDRLRQVRPNIQAIPKVNGSLFRLNRDTRFSRDKSPYKTHVGILLWEGERKRMENPGFYFHIEPDKLLLGAGLYRLPSHLLQPYREAVVSDAHGPALANVVSRLEAAGYAVKTEHYKRVPKGFDPDHPNARFLKFSGLAAMFECPLPDTIHSPEIIDFAMDHYQRMMPLHECLVSALGGV